MQLEILNKEEVDSFIKSCIDAGSYVESRKGHPPAGSTYEDGTLIERLVNTSWHDIVTRDYVEIKYKGTA